MALLRGWCTPTPDLVGPNRPTSPSAPSHSAWTSASCGIASVHSRTKQFIDLNGERACSARKAKAKQQQWKQQQHQHWPVVRGLNRHLSFTQHEKTPKRSQQERSIMKFLIGLSHDNKPRSSSSGNKEKMFLKGELSIKSQTQYDKINRLLQVSSMRS